MQMQGMRDTEIDDGARKVLAARKNLRVLATGAMPDPRAAGMTVRSVAGGYLLQSRDVALDAGEPRVVTKRAPSESETADLGFAFTVAKHVKSTAIVYARDGATLCLGAGLLSRVASARIAALTAPAAAALLLMLYPLIGRLRFRRVVHGFVVLLTLGLLGGMATLTGLAVAKDHRDEGYQQERATYQVHADRAVELAKRATPPREPCRQGMRSRMATVLQELAELVAAKLYGDGKTIVGDAAPLGSALSGQITMIDGPDKLQELASSLAVAVPVVLMLVGMDTQWVLVPGLLGFFVIYRVVDKRMNRAEQAEALPARESEIGRAHV